MNRLGIIILAVLGLVVVTAYSALFVVNEKQQALVLQFGQPKGDAITEPGLYWKLPFIQNVVFVDRRLLMLDSPSEEMIAGDRKRLIVDAFARYRISDPLRFYQSIREMAFLDNRLQPIFESSLRNVIGDSSLEELVRTDRTGITKRVQESFDKATQDLGINVVDVRIRRADLPTQNSEAIFRRMQTEREREAAEIRAQGQEAAQRIRSRADRDVTVLIAEAEREAQITRGEGDAKSNEIFANAYSQDPDFFDFYRSMQAYRAGLKGDSTTMILSPESDFFRYFDNDAGR